MQAYKIALYLFLFNYALCFFSGVQFFGSAYTTPPTIEEGVYSYGVNDSAFGGLSNETFVPGHDPALLNITQDFIDYQPNDLTNIGLLGAIALAINALANSTALLPLFLAELGIPTILNLMITGGCWFAYGWGVLQFVRGVGDRTIR